MARNPRKWNRVTTIYNFKNLKTVRVFGIARVSTDKQAKHGESLAHQKEVLANWVKTKSSINALQEWRLVEVYVENEERDGSRRGRSATTRSGRSGLAKAIELAKAKLIDVIVVTKLDRIARNVRDYIEISAELNENQVALVCLDLDIDTSTPDGQMIMRNHANLAQWQAERIAQYSLETARRHAAQGRPLGPAPVGYKKTAKETIVPDTVYRKHVEMIDQLYLKHKSMNRVVEELHKKGYKTPGGKTYTKPQIAYMLNNLRYIGQQEHEGKILKGNWEPIRSMATHERIQKSLETNRRNNRSPNRMTNRYPYFFQSLLKCSHCHSTMIPRPGTNKAGNYYPYYMCMRAEKTQGIDCDKTYLPAETVDNAIIEFIRKLHLEPSTIEKVVRGANQSTANRLTSLESDIDKIKERLKNIRTETSNIVNILAKEGVKKLNAFKDKLETLDTEEKELILEEKRIDQEVRAEKAQAGAAHDQIQTLNLFNDIFELNKNRPERIKSLLPRFVNYVACHITDKKKGVGRLDISFFGKPFVNGDNAEIWNETLKELAEAYNKNVNKELNRNKTNNNHSSIKSAHITSELDKQCGISDSVFADGFVSSET